MEDLRKLVQEYISEIDSRIIDATDSAHHDAATDYYETKIEVLTETRKELTEILNRSTSDNHCNNLDRCIRDKSQCTGCMDHYNEILQLPSLFKDYEPACPVGATDCVLDPAYILCYHPEWYHQMHGNLTPEEVINGENGCKSRLEPDADYCNDYDDEDK